MNRAQLSQFLCYLSALSLTLLLSACTTIATDPDLGVTTPPANKATDIETAIKTTPPRPKLALTEDILFKLLVAEFAGSRGNIDIAVDYYLELAQTTRDPVVIERATRIAVYARNDEAAKTAANLWTTIAPYDPNPHQVLAIIALRENHIDQALTHLSIILDNTDNPFDQSLWMVANFLGGEKNQAAVMQLLEKLMAKHIDDPEALYAFAHINARNGDVDRAQTLFERVLELKPDSEPAILSYISVLQRKGDSQKAINWLEQTLEKKPNHFNLRMAYARLLTDTKRFDEAKEQFKILIAEQPNHVDVLYALGLLYLQTVELEESEHYFKRLNKLNVASHDAISSYYLGNIAEQQSQWEQAKDWYQAVTDGEYYFNAQIRLGLILANQGAVPQALRHLRAIDKPKDPFNRLVLIQAEGEILTNAKRYQEAMDLFNQTIQAKSHPDLLYARAMLAEKMGQLNLLETDLKTILATEPDHATALNALGYTLADRTERYDEAYAYIQRAYELSPNDFYILDSMGWVLYRLGKLDESIVFLKKALALKNDPEIAAHLGEVLWITGDKQAAQTVWETALKIAPTDDRLLNIIKRFKP